MFHIQFSRCCNTSSVGYFYVQRLMYCWQLLLREVEAPDGTSTVVQNKEVCVKHHRQYPMTDTPDSVSAIVLLYEWQDTLFLQLFVNEHSSALRPLCIRLGNGITVFVQDSKSL